MLPLHVARLIQPASFNSCAPPTFAPYHKMVHLGMCIMPCLYFKLSGQYATDCMHHDLGAKQRPIKCQPKSWPCD